MLSSTISWPRGIRTISGRIRCARIPLGLSEGMAPEYLSIGPVDPFTANVDEGHHQEKRPAPDQKARRSKVLPYRYGHALWSYITGRLGDEVIGKLMKNRGRSGGFEPVLEMSLGAKLKKISEDWHKAMLDAYTPLYDKTRTLEKTGKAIAAASEMNFYNISPALSPDGKEMVFLSTRDLFSVDLYLADGRKQGRSRGKSFPRHRPAFRKPSNSSVRRFLDFKGERFVFGAVRQGPAASNGDQRPENKIEQEIPFPELGEILNPCWSPDGRFIAFSALAGGVSDIFHLRP